MHYRSYKDEHGKIWTRFDIKSAFPESDAMKQQKLDLLAKKSGWAEYEQPETEKERMEN